MITTNDLKMEASSVNIVATQGRGHTPEEFAEMTIDRIISIGKDANPVIRQQAIAYRDNIKSVLEEAFGRAMNSERTTLYNLLSKQGHGDMADIIKGI